MLADMLTSDGSPDPEPAAPGAVACVTIAACIAALSAPFIVSTTVLFLMKRKVGKALMLY
jgi:hypothetical protein